MSHLERNYRLYRTWGHSPISAYIEARKLHLPPFGMFWFFMARGLSTPQLRICPLPKDAQ